MHRPLRLTIDRSAIQANWRWLQDRAGVPAGAAIKADGYGLGAREAMRRAVRGGLPRLFRVDLGRGRSARAELPDDASLVVLHGVGPDDVEAALRSLARPVPQHAPNRWRDGRRSRPAAPCDVMIDTGINRLGLRPDEIGALDGLAIETLHSHLACADEDVALNAMQLERFRAVAARFRPSATASPIQRRHLPRPRL